MRKCFPLRQPAKAEQLAKPIAAFFSDSAIASTAGAASRRKSKDGRG
jgi:hypothetical protein